MSEAGRGRARMPRPMPAGEDSARWSLLESLFQEAVARAPHERGAWLDSACPDARMRTDVESLLTEHEGRGTLDRLMDEVMSPLLARPESAAGPAAATPAAPPAPGSAAADSPPTHAHYRIIDRVGGGGMGVVYRARDDRLERDVALKFLPPHLSADHAAKKRFLVEARAAAALEHPNICTVHEIGESADGQLYIVMAYYDGEPLDRRIARGPLPVEEAMRVAGEIARGLAKAHERGIVHRDIKPANVVVTRDGVVKILDFGIAKLSGAGVTTTVGAVGTLAYMSPEQAFGESVDHRTDLWSLGVVLYEMLAGVRPFRGPGEQAVLMAALTSDPEPLRGVRPEVSPELDAVVRRALAKKPAERFAGAAEFLAALAAVPTHLTPNATPTPVPVTGDGADAEPRDTALTRGGERRQVTVVSCGIAGHEALVERLEPEEADRVLAQVRDAAAEVATEHGGIVNHFSGEGFVMLFGVPTAHEDDAVRGVRAALALHARVAGIAATLDPRLASALRLRSGVHAGAVVAQRLRVGDRRYRITGAPADVSARLAAAAEPDTILVSPETRRLVAPFVRTAEGRAVPLHADGVPVVPHRVLGPSDARSRLEGAGEEGLTPFVGRERERALLAEHLASAQAGMGRVTVLLGEAGAGKSRLLHELRESATSAATRVFVGRCDAYGGTTPFLPFVEAAHEVLGLPRTGSAAERHDAAVGAARRIDRSLEEYIPLYLALFAIPSEAHPVPEHLRGESFQAAMLDAIAALFTLGVRERPALLILEDWQWADEGSRVALRQLAEIVPAFPLFLVVTSRPDGVPDLASADHQVLLHLAPLDSAASAQIVRAVLGAAHIDPELVARLHERTGGNPFFLEEVCEVLREEGAVTVRDGAAAAVESLHVPETVQGVLRTRLDRLDPEARDALRVASVIGREFTRGVLEEVPEAGRELARALERLKASGLVQQVGVVPEPAYRFKHALTQEVAYDSLLEHQRTTLHAAVGRAIERRYAARLDEHVERLMHHFGRAESWADAVRYALQAADRAAVLSQNADALATLERAEEWLLRMPDDAARRDLHADLLLRQERMCETMGLRSRQLAIADALIALLEPHGPSARLAQAWLRRGDACTLLRRYEAAERALVTALHTYRELQDGAGERNALRSMVLLRSYEGKNEEALAHIERVIALGREAGDTRAAAGDLATLANVLRTLGQPQRALEELESMLPEIDAAANPVRYAALLNVVGATLRDLGDLEAALDYFERSVAHGLGARHTVTLVTLPNIANIHLELGRVDQALETFRQSVELNLKARYADGSAHANRTYGEALIGLERHAEAIPYLQQAAGLFSQLEDRANERLMWRRLATAHDVLGHAAEAREAWARVREILRGADPRCEAEALEGIARAERRMSVDLATVVAHYEEALRLAAQGGDAERELALHNALGIALWQEGRYEDGVAHFDAALAICRATGDCVHEGLMLNSLGASYLRMQRLDEAHAVLTESLRVTAQAGERQLRAHALAALADTCLAAGRPGEACAHAEASLALRRELGDRRGEGWMLERLARARAAQGAREEAATLAEAARGIAIEMGDEALGAALARLQDSPAPSVPPST